MNEGGRGRRVGRRARGALGVAWLALPVLLLWACAPQAPKLTSIPNPVKLKIESQPTAVVLTWPGVSGASAYNLYVASAPGNVLGGTKLAGVSSPYTHRGLKLGDTRYYQLTAVIGGKEQIVAGVARGVAYHAAKVFPTFYAVVVKPGDTLALLADQYLDDPEKGPVIADFNQVDEIKVNQPLIIPRRTAVLGGLTPNAYQTIPVLAYNDFSRDQKNAGTVMLADFEQQMQFLRDKGYRVISLNAFMEFMNMKAAVPERAVVITVDVGWKSFYTLAYPVLQRYRYPATLFVRSGEIGANPLAMDWKQVRELSAGGIDIECNSHTQMGLEDAAGAPFDAYLKAIRAEITLHLAQMRKGAEVTCRHFAYPTGNASHLVVAMLQKYGIESGFTLRRGTNPFFFNNFRLRRYAVSGTYDLKRFEQLLSTSSDQLLK